MGSRRFYRYIHWEIRIFLAKWLIQMKKVKHCISQTKISKVPTI